MEVILRKSALAQGLSKYFTGKPCGKGHVVERYTTSRGCVVCAGINQKTRDAIKNTGGKHHRAPDPDAKRAYDAVYVANNIDRIKKRSSAYAKANPTQYAVRNARRRSMKRDQTPTLTSTQELEIELLYAESGMLGNKFHVDHIIPLFRGGLHHPDNLQIVPANYNLRKGAKILQERKYL